MSDSITKSEEMEESKSYSGIGPNEIWNQTTTYDQIPDDSKNNETLLTDLLLEFKTWNDLWEIGIKDVINSAQFVEELSKRYKISKK